MDKRDLERKIAWLENVAEGRGEENERLRERLRALNVVCGEIQMERDTLKGEVDRLRSEAVRDAAYIGQLTTRVNRLHRLLDA